MPSKNS